MTHICVSKLTNIGSDYSLSPGRHQTIIRINAGILLIGHQRTNFCDISIEIHTFSVKKLHFKMSSAKRWPFLFVLNLLIFRHYGTSGFSNVLVLSFESCSYIAGVTTVMFFRGECDIQEVTDALFILKIRSLKQRKQGN